MKQTRNYQQMAAECIAYLVRQSRVTGKPITGPEEAAQYAALALVATGDFGREVVGLLCLNARNAVLDCRVIAQGTVNQAPAYLREIARAALFANATGVILFHNHPGGHCRPSSEDLALTRQLAEGLRPLDIDLLDHLILASHEAFSITNGLAVSFAPPADDALF